MHRRFVGGALALLGVVLLQPAPAPAGIPLGGLAVAVSADGTRLVAGGDSRALYVLDPESLAVKQRVHLGRAIVALAFSPDGTRVVAESTKAVQILDATTWKVLATLPELERISVAGTAGLVAAIARRPTAVQVISMADGSVKASVPYDRKKTVAAFGLDAQGKRLAMLYYRSSSTSETKVASKDIPKELNGAALGEFKQRHDGYTARFQVVDVATGKSTLDKELFYSASGGGNRLCWHGDDVCIVSYQNSNAKVDPEGGVTYFELGNSYNYGIGMSTDGAVILSGGLRNGSRTTVADLAGTPFKLDELPGFPEYFKSFSLTAQGLGYAGTSCWRVVRLDAAGAITKTAPIY